MPRDLILGTAGHIDHGKTTLIRALTGTDCDRFPEEKARGITLDVGFASLNLPDVHFGIVDVPGHERYVHNMLVAAAGIDVALLVISAKEGVRAQTREHLAILDRLAISRGLVVLTMIDLVDIERIMLVKDEIRQFLRGTFLETSPIVPVSAATGEGISDLKLAINHVGKSVPDAGEVGRFRLAIDRSFSVAGQGTVVTGTVLSGRVEPGDSLTLYPHNRTVRVRGLQRHDVAVESGRRGQRLAINLAAIEQEEVARGDVLAAADWLAPSRLLTVELTALADAPRPLKHRGEVRVHTGTLETLGRLSMLDGTDQIAPGETAIAQLHLNEPAATMWGDRVIVRSASAQETLAGGRVIQPVASKFDRRDTSAVRALHLAASESAADRMLSVVESARGEAVSAAHFLRDAGVAEERQSEIVDQLVREGSANRGDGGRLLTRETLADWGERISAALLKLHEREPLTAAHSESVILQVARLPESAAEWFGTIAEAGTLHREANGYRHSSFRTRLSQAEEALCTRIVAAYRDAAFQPPDRDDFLAEVPTKKPAKLQALFDHLVDRGSLKPIGGGLYLAAEWHAKLLETLAAFMADGNGQTVSAIREALQTTRKYAVPLCEYLDREGYTRRDGNLRFWRKEPS